MCGYFRQEQLDHLVAEKFEAWVEERAEEQTE